MRQLIRIITNRQLQNPSIDPKFALTPHAIKYTINLVSFSAIILRQGIEAFDDLVLDVSFAYMQNLFVFSPN